MGQTEVTQAQYQRLTGKNPSLTRGDNLPVTRVSWEDVQEFLKAVNHQSSEFHLRLPTEEEWEYACRAGSELPFAPPGRNAEDLQQALQKHQQGDPEFLVRFVARFAWFNQGHPQPVRSLLPNAWGLFDMHGNVWEWCADDAPDSDLRPLRGGCWATSEVFGCRAALRAWEPRDSCKDSIGFRLLAEPR
jgi:formylglycine-generating enzyme required for sulfatase activity